MNDSKTTKVHWSFWAIGVIALIWNGLGVVNYLVQMNPEMLAAYRETEQAIIANRPSWATAGFAFAVFGGTLGCLLLLFRKATSYYLFMLSMLGVVITMAYTLTLDVDFGPGEIIGIILMPLAVAAFLIWYAWLARGRAWIK